MTPEGSPRVRASAASGTDGEPRPMGGSQSVPRLTVYETDPSLGLLAMCVNKREIFSRSGLRVEVPCRKCWQCRTSRVWDWVGKCIAESKTASSVSFVTLTYGQGKWVREPRPEHHSKSLVYEDVQLWLKRIRKAGYAVRYVIAGEYGERKGRAHWHCLLFWQGKEPNHSLGNEWKDQFWPHGHVNWKEFSVENAKYVCKYLLKYEDEEHIDQETGEIRKRSTEFHFSARPGIGFEYLKRRAERFVDHGLSPQDAWYYFPEVRNKDGKMRQFYLSPAAQVNLVKLFQDAWYEKLRAKVRRDNPAMPEEDVHDYVKAGKAGHPPPSKFCEKINDLAATPILLDILHKRNYRGIPTEKPPGDGKIFFDEKLNAYFYWFGSKPEWEVKFYWSFDEKGRRSWQRVFVTEAEARLREAASDAGLKKPMRGPGEKSTTSNYRSWMAS